MSGCGDGVGNSRHWPGRLALAVGIVLGSAGLVCAADEPPRQLTGELLERALELGGRYLVHSQRPAGNFVYEYDFVAGHAEATDNAVRQTGALWGLALIHRAHPSGRTESAVARGLAFFRKHTRRGRGALVWPVYPDPDQATGKTNVVALLVLTLVDLLQDDELDADLRVDAEKQLDRYLRFLLSLRRDVGFFHGQYSLATGRGHGAPSPYADGEALLAMARAARFAGHGRLKARLLESAQRMHGRYVTAALQRDPDSDVTKGFYHWGSLAFFEIHDAGWDSDDQFARHTIDMAHWMIDVHQTLRRSRNTAYAHEGLAVAYELARRLGDEEARNKFAAVIDQGLYKLTSWQVGGPNPNQFLRDHPTDDPLAVGGVMNGAEAPVLRIDVTQHQMHAIILARRFLYHDR